MDENLTDDDNRFLARGEHCWGKGATFEAAVKRLKVNMASYGKYVVMAFVDTVPNEVQVCSMTGSFTWFGTEERPVVVFDNRSKADKKRMPRPLGERVKA